MQVALISNSSLHIHGNIFQSSTSNILVQFSPSPVNPVRHSQLYPPYEFLQLAYLEQLCVPSEHSSISEKDYSHIWLN